MATRAMPKYSYSQEEMLEIAMQIQQAGIRSHFLPVEFNNEMGLFDPDLWIRSIWEKEDPNYVAARKKPAFVAPVERLKTEAAGGEEIVLSPQRRSFGQGCRREASRPESPRVKNNSGGQSEATVELLDQLFPTKGPEPAGRKSAPLGAKPSAHPAAVIGAARGRSFQPSFAQRPEPPRPEEDFDHFKLREGNHGMSWREQMQGPPIGAWRKRGNSGSELGSRRFDGGRNRGGSGQWGGRNEALPEWMDEEADETMELGGFDEHEARKAREKEHAAQAKEWAEAPPPPPPPPRQPSPPPQPSKQPPGPMLEKESDFADMFGLTPSQVDAGVDILFPFMATGSGGGFLSGSSVSVPGQAARVNELKAAGQSRFSRFFGAPKEEPKEPVVAEQRQEAQRVAEAESKRIMAKLLQGGPNASALQSILSNGAANHHPPPPMPQPSNQPHTMSLQDIEAKLRDQNGLNGRPLEGQPGRGLFGRAKEEGEEEAPEGGRTWQAAKGNPLSDPAGQAHLLQSLNKLSLESAQLHQAEASAQHQASALQQLLQQSQRPPMPQPPMQPPGSGFPPHAFGPTGRLQAPPPPMPARPPMPGFPNPGNNMEAQQAAMNLIKAMAAKAQAHGHPAPPPEQSAFLLAQLMARHRPQGPPMMPPQGPPRPQTVHMPPFVNSAGGGPPAPGANGIPPPELYHLLAMQHAKQQQPPPQPPPPSSKSGAYGPGFMPLSVLKQAAGRKVETSVDAHLAALGKSQSDGTSDEDENYGAKRMAVASGSTPGRGPFAPPLPHQPPVSSSNPSHQQQYLSMLQASNRDGREGGGNAAMVNMARAHQMSALQNAAARGDPSAIQALHALQHAANQHRAAMEAQMAHVSQASAVHHQSHHGHFQGGSEGGGEGTPLARLFGAGGGARIPANARPLSLEEVERSAAKAAASQPFI